MDVFISNIRKTETESTFSGEGKTSGWQIHFVSTLDPSAEIVYNGDFFTEDADLAAQFELRGRWTLTRS